VKETKMQRLSSDSPDAMALALGGIPEDLWPSIIDIKNKAQHQGLTDQEIEVEIDLSSQGLCITQARPTVGFAKPPYRAEKTSEDWSAVVNAEGFNALSFPDSGAKFVSHETAELIAKTWNDVGEALPAGQHPSNALA
jgi:hypothetical protein